MVNGVENEKGNVLKGNTLHANSHGSKFKRVDSLDLESSTVFGMATHGSLCDIWKWKKMELGAQIASKELEDEKMEVMVNGVANEEGDVLKGNKLHANSHGSNFKRVGSLHLESSTVFGLATHGSRGCKHGRRMFVLLQLYDIWKWNKMELGAQIASKELEDVQMEMMVNGVENEECDVLKGNKLHANSHGSKFKRVDSLDLESNTFSGMDTHGSLWMVFHLYTMMDHGGK